MQVAQVVHAAGESVTIRPAPGTIAVALHAEGAEHLLALHRELEELDIEHTLIYEADGPYAGQAMALGLEPSRDRLRARRVLSKLPLVR